MIQIEKIKVETRYPNEDFVRCSTKYRLYGFGKDHKVIGEVDSLEKASCVTRFVHGANLKNDEYALAVKTLREIDRANNAEVWKNDKEEQ